MKAMASQISCGGHVVVSSCGMMALYSRGGCCRKVTRSPEQDQHGDGEADEAGGFGEGEAQEQRAALCRGGCRVAQGAHEVIAEDMADADTGAAKRNGRNAGTDHLCCFNIHFDSPWCVRGDRVQWST